MDKFKEEGKRINKKLHEERTSDPIYMEGYNAKSHWCYPHSQPCPYEMDQELDIARIMIAGLDRALTPEEKCELTRLNDLFDKTEWDRWISGNYYRWCVEST